MAAFQATNTWAQNVNSNFAFGNGIFGVPTGSPQIDDPASMFKKSLAMQVHGQVQRLMLAKTAAENPDQVLDQYTTMMGKVANASDPFIGLLTSPNILKSFQDNMPFLSPTEVNAVYLSFITDAANRYTQMITMANPVALRIAQDIGTELNAPLGIGRGPSGSKRSSRRSSGR